MKTTLFTLLLLTISSITFSQSRDFNGLWEGTMTKTDGTTFNLKLFIEDNNVYSVTKDKDGDLIKNKQFEVRDSKGYGEQLNYYWMNKGGVWTETQIFSISWTSEKKLSVYFMRHVSNLTSDKKGNTDWGYFAKGVLE